MADTLVTSRDNADIRAKLGSLNTDTRPVLFEYFITRKDTKQDVRFWSTEVVNLDLSIKPKDLRKKIAEEAARKSDGMFLWVQLLHQSLDPGESTRDLLKAVSGMPMGIDQAYARELEQLESLPDNQK